MFRIIKEKKVGVGFDSHHLHHQNRLKFTHLNPEKRMNHVGAMWAPTLGASIDGALISIRKNSSEKILENKKGLRSLPVTVWI